MKNKTILPFIIVCLLLQSCEFHCSVGNAEESNKSSKTNSKTPWSNNIHLEANDVKVKDAYLVYADGSRVSADNRVEFNQTIKMIVLIDSGWTIHDNKVFLGASETIVDKDGSVLMVKDDLFEKYPDGISAGDARIIGLSATIKYQEQQHPEMVQVRFKVWDKKAPGFIEGHYDLYAK